MAQKLDQMYRSVYTEAQQLPLEEEKKIEHIKTPPSCWVILAKPHIGVSTADVYGNLKLNRVTHPNVDKMVDVINSGDYKGICDTVGNVFRRCNIWNAS